MASQKELFKLIKSLEKSEKQAITFERKKKNKTPKYLVLYKWLEDWGGTFEEYNRNVAIEEIGEGWGIRTLRTAESQLYDKIIEILGLTQLGKSSITTINQKIAEADILKNKGFYIRSLEYLNKALAAAYKHQKYSLIIEIIPRKIDAILLTTYKDRGAQVEKSYQELRIALQTTQQEADFRSLNIRLLIQYQESRNPDNIPNSIKEDYSELIAKKFPKQGSFFSQYYFYSIQAIWANIHKDYTAAHQHQYQVVQLWRKNDPIRSNNRQSYLTQLANLANYAIAAKDFEAANEVILLMEDFSTNNQDEKAEQTQNLLFYKQFLLLNQKNFKEAKKLIPAIEDLLIRPEKEKEKQGQVLSRKEKKGIVHSQRINPSRLYNFHYNTLITCLLCHEYEEANEWLVRISSLYEEKEPRKDIGQVIRILRLVINYGLKSPEFSLVMFERLYRKTAIKKNMSVFETVLLQFFKKMYRTAAATQNPKKHFKLLSQELQALEDKDKNVIGYYEVLLWVQSQL